MITQQSINDAIETLMREDKLSETEARNRVDAAIFWLAIDAAIERLDAKNKK